MDGAGFFLVLLLLLVAYFFPTIVARLRGKSNATAIGVLNLLAGWTFIGWVVALVWACTNDAPTKA